MATDVTRSRCVATLKSITAQQSFLWAIELLFSWIVVSRERVNGIFVLSALEFKRTKVLVISAWSMRLTELVPNYLVLAQANVGDQRPTPHLTTFTRQDVNLPLVITYDRLLLTKEVARQRTEEVV